MEELSRTYSGPTGTYQSFEISFYDVDYLIAICTLEGIGSITIRGPGGGTLFGQIKPGILVFDILSKIVQSKEFKGRNGLGRLPDKPIVIFDAHESPDDGGSCIIFQKATINHASVLRARYVQYINGILRRDAMITLYNLNGELQLDGGGETGSEKMINPVLLSNNDLDQISRLLLAVVSVQRNHYQGKVDTLLSSLPLYASK